MWLDSEAGRAGRRDPLDDPATERLSLQRPPLAPQLEQGDVVQAPWPDVPIASIDPADIAAVAATVLTEPGYERAAPSLSGPEPLTPGEQVATLAQALQRPLRYEALDDDKARAAMATDTPADFIDAFFRFFSHGEFDDAAVVDAVQQITGHPPRTFAAMGRSSRPRVQQRALTRPHPDRATGRRRCSTCTAGSASSRVSAALTRTERPVSPVR